MSIKEIFNKEVRINTQWFIVGVVFGALWFSIALVNEFLNVSFFYAGLIYFIGIFFIIISIAGIHALEKYMQEQKIES